MNKVKQVITIAQNSSNFPEQTFMASSNFSMRTERSRFVNKGYYWSKDQGEQRVSVQ